MDLMLWIPILKSDRRRAHVPSLESRSCAQLSLTELRLQIVNLLKAVSKAKLSQLHLNIFKRT